LKRARLAAVGCGAFALIGGATWWISLVGGRPDVPTLVVSKAAFARLVAAEGNLEAAEATPVTAPIDAQGQLKVAWLVPDGTPVKAGDVIVRFDPSEMERSLRDGQSDETATRSRIVGMRAETGGAIRNLERDAALAREELRGADRYKVDDPDVFSRQEIIRSEIDRTLATQRIDTADQVRSIRQDVAKVDLDLLDIERRKAGIAIDRASKGLEALEIKAPHDGILVYKRDWRGDITRIGDTVWPGEPVGEIPELKTMQARVYVLEADAGGLTKGLSATVVVEAHPAVTYRAKIKKVDTLAKRRTGWIPVQYSGATLELDATDPAVMKPGQRVRAVLALDARPDAFSVPRNAIFEKNGKKIVYKLDGRAFVPVEVELGPAAVGRVVVEKGLAKGDEIALSDPLAAAGEAQANSASGGSPTTLPGAR
jgi:RND family efflux transporter MFP subunit